MKLYAMEECYAITKKDHESDYLELVDALEYIHKIERTDEQTYEEVYCNFIKSFSEYLKEENVIAPLIIKSEEKIIIIVFPHKRSSDVPFDVIWDKELKQHYIEIEKEI